MPRQLTVMVPPDKTDRLISDLGELDGVLSIQLNRGAGVQPESDVITAVAANSEMFEVLRVVERSLGGKPESLTLSSPVALYSESKQDRVDADVVESVWEETEYTLQQTSRSSLNFILLMVFAGILAAVRLSTGMLHMVAAGGVGNRFRDISGLKAALRCCPATVQCGFMQLGLLSAQSDCHCFRVADVD